MIRFISSFLFILNIFIAQSQNIDSLKTIVEDSNKINQVKAYFELSRIYKYDSTIIAKQYAQKALEISRKINNDTLIVTALNGLCPIKLLQNDTDGILIQYNRAIRLCEKSNFKKGLAITYNNIGSFYNKTNQLDTAIYFYLKSGLIFDKLGLYKVAASTYNNVGITYYKQARYEKSLHYFIKSLKIKERVLPNGKTVANSTALAASMVNVGLFYYKLEKNNEALKYLRKADLKAQEAQNTNISCIAKTNIGIILNTQQKYDSALFYLNKALVLAKKMNNIQRESTALSALSNVYNNLNKIDLSIDYALKSLTLHKQTHNIRGISIIENSLADLYLKQKNYTLAKTYGLKALTTAKNSKNIESQIKISNKLSEIFEELKEYQQALFYKKYYNTLKDSINNINNKEIITEIETKYETEKKNVEIKELKIKDIKNENTKRLYLIMAAFLLAALVSFLFFFIQKHRINKILNNKNQELKKLNTTQNRLMSIISHDFKAPMSAFYSITSSLKNKIEKIEKSDIKEYLSRMQNSALGLKLQLENMLNWSISQSTQINVSKSELNLSVLVYKTTVVLEEFAKEKNISFNINIDENINIYTDGQLLNIVLNNLITNTIKFSKQDSSIELSAKRENKKISITIKDFGIGISKDHLKTLFLGQENNSKTENTGTGLGLIVSKDIIEKLDGEIWAESEINKETTFYILLNG